MGWTLVLTLKRVGVIEEARGGAIIMADSSEPTREEKIADALRAAPAYIADSATVIDWDVTTLGTEMLRIVIRHQLDQ